MMTEELYNELKKNNMPTLKFSKNWNNKLNSDYFTTFRLDGSWHRKGQVYDIELQDTAMGKGICLDKKVLKLSAVNDWIAGLDAATDAKGFREIVRVMYSKKVDINTADFCLLLIKKLKN